MSMNGAKVRPRRRRRACVLLDKQINSHSRNTQNSRRVVKRGRKLMMGEEEEREISQYRHAFFWEVYEH